MKNIYQGSIGNCFLIAAIMSITLNKKLIAHIMPYDNSLPANMKLGAYHFRFWTLGFWTDVVIDDYLPMNTQGSLLFLNNKIYPNEFWAPLLEKAFAKLVGFIFYFQYPCGPSIILIF